MSYTFKRIFEFKWYTYYDPFHFKRIFAKIIKFMIHNKMAHQNYFLIPRQIS